MRIISGYLKRKKIVQPLDKTTRPLKDMVKEGIFNIIVHSKKFSFDLNNSKILDLFSGVGSFGLECLSRGADYVTFVENHSKTLDILEQNIQNFNLKDKCEVITNDIYMNNFFRQIKNKYEFIFLDPPFKENKILHLLSNLFLENILTNNTLIILHRHKKSQDIFPSNFKILEEKIYGLSKIYFGVLN
jgi:16S rRNA (guanine966-N2)-methyltransferase